MIPYNFCRVFECILTCAERNKFDEYINSLPQWIRLEELWALHEAEVYRGNGREALSFQRAMQPLFKECRVLCNEFYQNVILPARGPVDDLGWGSSMFKRDDPPADRTTGVIGATGTLGSNGWKKEEHTDEDDIHKEPDEGVLGC